MRIALIDDEQKWRNIICSKIKEYFSDEEIQVFASGDEFLQKEQVFEIVFVDIEMDGRDGFETATEYEEYSPDSVIMILTTHREMVKRGYAVNVFRYLDKVKMDEELEEVVFAVKKKFEKNRKIHVPVVGLGDKIFELKKIRDGAFRWCPSLTQITIPKKVKIIDEYAFWDCENLKKITFNGTVPKIKKEAFKNININAEFKVPAKYRSEYKKQLEKNAWYKTTMCVK